MELDELRVQIDEIDKGIVELFSKRMEVSKNIALCKKAEGRQVFDPQREQEKISTLREKAHGEFNALPQL